MYTKTVCVAAVTAMILMPLQVACKDAAITREARTGGGLQYAPSIAKKEAQTGGGLLYVRPIDKELIQAIRDNKAMTVEQQGKNKIQIRRAIQQEENKRAVKKLHRRVRKFKP